MILTGPEIVACTREDKIRISSFQPDQVNPNSYNVCLGETLITYTGDVIDAYLPNPTETIKIDSGGYILQPGELYLGHTVEEVGSDYFVLRGGSWATGARVGTPTFRNWDYPQRRQIFAGFRVARDAA